MYFQNIQNREWTKAGQVPLGKIGEHDRASPAGRDASSDDAKNSAAPGGPKWVPVGRIEICADDLYVWRNRSLKPTKQL